MGMLTGAVIASAVIGAGSSLYAADQQKKAQEADRKRREQEAAAAKAESDRIARDTKPEEEALDEISYGTNDEFTGVGSTQEFIVPKNNSIGSSGSGRSGLGFTV